MSSPSKQTETIRNRKRGNAGSKRKAKDRNSGTTKTPAQLFGDEE